MQIKNLCLFAAAAFALSSPAFAQPSAPVRAGDTVTITRDGTDLNIARAAPTESIEVTGRALPEGTPVAVQGTVAGRVGSDLIVARPGGDVIAKIRRTGEPLGRFYGRAIAREVGMGDSVTVFGNLRTQGDRLAVLSDAVYDNTSGSLYFTHESDQFEASPFYNQTGRVLDGHALNRRYRVL